MPKLTISPLTHIKLKALQDHHQITTQTNTIDYLLTVYINNILPQDHNDQIQQLVKAEQVHKEQQQTDHREAQETAQRQKQETQEQTDLERLHIYKEKLQPYITSTKTMRTIAKELSLNYFHVTRVLKELRTN